jgi:hypothetical protein
MPELRDLKAGIMYIFMQQHLRHQPLMKVQTDSTPGFSRLLYFAGENAGRCVAFLSRYCSAID